MALPTFEKQSDIPKGFEDEYEEVDGKWVPIDHASKLESALKAEREKREQAEALAKKAAKEAATAAAENQARAGGMSDEELRKLHDTISASFREENESLKAKNEALQQDLRGLRLDREVKDGFKAAGAVAARVDDFWKLHSDEFDLTSDGKPMVKNEPGKDVAKHIAGIMKRRPEWVQGTKASGSGAGGFQSTTAPQSTGPLTFDDVMANPAAAIASANERG